MYDSVALIICLYLKDELAELKKAYTLDVPLCILLHRSSCLSCLIFQSKQVMAIPFKLLTGII